MVDCPLCNGNSKLEVRSTDHIFCRHCHFVGDLVSLFRAYRDVDIRAAIGELQTRSLAEMDRLESSHGLDYFERYDQQQRLQRVWRNGVDRLSRGNAGSVRAILDQLGLSYSEEVLRKLLPHVCLLRRSDFDAEGFEFQQTSGPALKWWGKYSAMAVPAWDEANLVGFWLLTTKGASYLPLIEWCDYSNGFGLVPSIMDDAVVVVNSIYAAFRCSIWSILETGKLRPFVVPYGLRDNVETYQGGRTIFWAPDGDSHWYLRSINTPSAQIVDHRQVPVDNITVSFPCDGCYAEFMRQIIDSLPSHQGVAYHLLTLTEAEAKRIFVNTGLDPADKAKILAYVHGDDADRIAALFEKTVKTQAITWNGSIISDTPEGWVCKGEIISSVKLVIEQVRPNRRDSDAMVIGNLVYKGRSYKFREKFSVLRTSSIMWIQKLIVMNAGCIPYISKAWGSKLVEIAQQFHTPTPVMDDQQYGWTEGKLRFPHFAVDETNIYATQCLVEGPRMLLPAPLSQSEWAAYKNKVFCKIVLVMMGNLFRTRHNQPGIGIMLTNQPHVVGRLASTFACEMLVNPTMDMVAQNAYSPLPLFTDWSEFKLRNVFEEAGYKNIIFSTDSHTAKLNTLNQDWVQIKTLSAIDYMSLRSMFILLPNILRSQRVRVDTDTFYRDIADTLAAEVGKHFEHHKLVEAAMDLDHRSSYRSSTAASRIVELIFYGVDMGDIHPKVEEDHVLVSKSEFLVATSSPLVPLPSMPLLTDALTEARFLATGDTRHQNSLEKYWLINRSAWDMNMSLHAMEKALG